MFDYITNYRLVGFRQRGHFFFYYVAPAFITTFYVYLITQNAVLVYSLLASLIICNLIYEVGYIENDVVAVGNKEENARYLTSEVISNKYLIKKIISNFFLILILNFSLIIINPGLMIKEISFQALLILIYRIHNKIGRTYRVMTFVILRVLRFYPLLACEAIPISYRMSALVAIAIYNIYDGIPYITNNFPKYAKIISLGILTILLAIIDTKGVSVSFYYFLIAFLPLAKRYLQNKLYSTTTS